MVFLGWILGLDFLPPKLSEIDAEPINHLKLWKKSISLAEVAKSLSAAPLFPQKDLVPIEEVQGALDVLEGVLQPTAMKHLVRTSGCAASWAKPRLTGG